MEVVLWILAIVGMTAIIAAVVMVILFVRQISKHGWNQ